MRPLLSICIPTFQHAAFIAQTLDGCLAQQTEFEIEIVVGDDGSTDEAPQLIKEYAERFPDQIRAYLHPANLGPKNPKELGGKNNVIFLLSQCRGNYIAFCEGDDYWTHPLKLQRQVDFLERHSDFALTHHQTEVIYEDKSPSHWFNPAQQAPVTTIVDLFSDVWYVATCSAVFRNVYQEGLPDWFLDTGSGDLGIFLLAAHHGKIRYFEDPMAVYRRHRGGLSNFQHLQNRFFVENRMKLYQDVNAYFGGIYEKDIQDTVQKYQQLLLNFTL
ncbi:MAG: glycosyltransferase [Spirosomataceae bacterium]